MRLFVAADLNDGLKAELRDAQKTLARFSGRGLRLSGESSLHLTFKFIGDLAEAQLADACSLVREAVRTVAPQQVTLSGAGAFPPKGHVRVCWVGLHAETEGLSALAGDLEDAFELLEVPAERRAFFPHITIARAGRDFEDSDSLRTALARLKIRPLGQSIDAVTLYASHLGPSGSTYEALEVFSFGAAV